MTISPNRFYTLAEAARLLMRERRALLLLIQKHKYPFITTGSGKGTRHIIKGKYLLSLVKKR